MSHARGIDPRQSLDTPSLLESRRSSVDSRVNAGFGHLAISPSSPYQSENASRVSLASNLQQQRAGGGPFNGLMGANQSTPVSPSALRFDRMAGNSRSLGLGGAPRRAPVINPNPRNVSGMPDPTAAAPTKGFPWAFPDHEDDEASERRGSSSGSSVERSLVSRQNSYAASTNSVLTTDSHLPPGQRRFEDGDIQHTHHHSMQHRAVTQLQSDGQPAVPGGNYSRTPELRISHKMAERKRRSEMKTLFDELNGTLPNNPGGKSSKWEVLTKAIEYINRLKVNQGHIMQENEQLRGRAEYGVRVEQENTTLRTEITACFNHIQRAEPGNHHVFGPFTAELAEGHRATNGNINPVDYTHANLPTITAATMPPPPHPHRVLQPAAAAPPAPMEGVQQYSAQHY